MVAQELPSGLTVGVVSEGTLRLRDLMDAALGVLEKLDADMAAQFRAIPILNADDEYETYEDVLRALSACLPEGYYYGPTVGDGACYGIWRISDDDEFTASGG